MTYSNPEAYERFMGRWSARLAPLFIRFAGVKDGQRVLDVGCGTGSLSRALLAASTTINVVAVDPVASFVCVARKQIPDSRVQFEVGAAETLPFPSGPFDAVFSLLVLQDLADPHRAVLEMARVTRRGGAVAACQWDFQDGLPMLSLVWQAAEAIAPEAVARHQAAHPSSPLRRGGLKGLAELWTNAGFSKVRTASLELSMEFSSFDDFWLPFLGGATPMSSLVAAINRETAGALARGLGDMIADVQPDGSFRLPARAWTVAGIAGH